MLRKICILLIALLAVLPVGCRKAETQPTETSACPPLATEAVTEALPVTEAASETAPEPETVPETEPPRTFTEADFNFYVDGCGEPDPDRINITFYPNGTDPDIRVWNSCQITNPVEIRDICGRILASEYYDFDRYGRTLDSMVVEWQAHNGVNALYDNERTRHVDFNRADEGVTYLEFWQRAMGELTIDN